MIITGGDEGRLADPAEVVRLLRHGHASVVTDLSRLGAAARAAYAADLASAVEAHRAATGIPQWVVVDEAHGPIGRDPTARRLFDPAAEGYLLITWQPEELSADALARPRRRHHPRLRPAGKPVHRHHRGGGRYAPR